MVRQTKARVKNKKSTGKIVLGAGVLFVAIFIGVFIFGMLFKPLEYNADTGGSGVDLIDQKEEKKVAHLKTPDAVRAIYMTSCVVATPSFRDRLVALVEETEVNSLIIDIKDFTGTLSYKPNDPELLPLWENARCGTGEMEEFLTSLHEKGVYVIGRITVFQDPFLSETRPDLTVKFSSTGETWRDHKGLSFTDVGSKEVWDHHVAISRDAYNIGFDELNFDYIRFPSDGPMNDIYFPFSGDRPKAEVLESFFSYLDSELEGTGIVKSADLFGMVTTNTDDLNIGQVLERALPYFDFIAPMTYPSHYPNGFNGWPNPNEVPYEILKFSMDAAIKRTIATTTTVKTFDGKMIASTTPQLYTKTAFNRDKIRPWLQDFDYPVPYTPEMVMTQMQAVRDSGLDSWMLWDPSNTYTRSALRAE